MKNLVILMGTILLGTVIFQMMTGDQPGSLKSAVSDVMRASLEQYAQEGRGNW